MEQVIVCGGGPAGLAAAMWLGRYRRKTLVLDHGRQRNRAANASHGYLSRDGAEPGELLELARRDATRYSTVRTAETFVDDARRDDDTFVVEAAGKRHRAHRLLLATGVEDAFPDIAGFGELYGTSVFHCPCCDGFEARGKDVLAIGWGDHTTGFALDLLEWGANVTLVTDGRELQGGDECLTALHRHDVEVLQEPVEELCRRDGRMTGARLASGRVLDATMAFFSIAHRPRNDLAAALGCELDEGGYVKIDEHGETSVPGVYAAGDVTPGEQLVQVAAAQGAIAGIACAMSLRGMASPAGAPQPGPDPESELGRA